MTYIIYQTAGIILGHKDFGEADRLVAIYTEQFGKINAIAQGVRYLKSKLRYNLEKFSFSRLALVRGKPRNNNSPAWRIVDAQEDLKLDNLRQDDFQLGAFARIAGILNRMAQGEEKNQSLWNEIRSAFIFLNSKKLNRKELGEFEIRAIFSILAELGYIDKTGQEFFPASAVKAINRAIKESML